MVERKVRRDVEAALGRRDAGQPNRVHHHPGRLLGDLPLVGLRQARAARLGMVAVEGKADVVHRDGAVPVVGIELGVQRKRVPRVLVPRQVARAGQLAIERRVSPGEVAVQVEPDASRPLRGACQRRVG